MPRIVYSDSFVSTVQPPEAWDRRPVPNLLHRARDPVTRDQELDRLELLLRAAGGNVLVSCRVHGSAVDFGDRYGHAALFFDRLLQTRDVFAQD